MFLKVKIWPSFEVFQNGGCYGITDRFSHGWHDNWLCIDCYTEQNSDKLNTPIAEVTGVRGILEEKAQTLDEL